MESWNQRLKIKNKTNGCEFGLVALGMEHREAKWQVSAHTARKWQTSMQRAQLLEGQHSESLKHRDHRHGKGRRRCLLERTEGEEKRDSAVSLILFNYTEKYPMLISTLAAFEILSLPNIVNASLICIFSPEIWRMSFSLLKYT